MQCLLLWVYLANLPPLSLSLSLSLSISLFLSVIVVVVIVVVIERAIVTVNFKLRFFGLSLLLLAAAAAAVMADWSRGSGRSAVSINTWLRTHGNNERFSHQHQACSACRLDRLTDCKIFISSLFKQENLRRYGLHDLLGPPSAVSLSPERIAIKEFYFIHSKSGTVLGYWHQRADERHGNPPPR